MKIMYSKRIRKGVKVAAGSLVIIGTKSIENEKEA